MRLILRLTKYFSLLGLFCLLLGGVALGVSYLVLEPKLPDIDTLKDVKLQVPLRIYSADNELIAEYGEKRRNPLTFAQIPQNMVNAFLAAEDDRFYIHPGVDYQGILRAVWYIVKTGEKGPGGSTITMQVARNFFLSREKTYLRKLNEIFLSLKIERELSKNEILELYLNKIYLGHRAYGVGAAAQVYYGKPVSELSLGQTAMIAGLPKAPSRFNPLANPQRAKIRRAYVLNRMHDLGYISKADLETSLAEPLSAIHHGQAIELDAPYIAEMVRAEMTQRFGNDAYTEGYQVFTTINGVRQRAANKALRNALIDYERRHGYRGAEQKLNLPDELTTNSLTEVLRGIPTIGDLIPGIVTEISDDGATVFAMPDQWIRLTETDISWARRFLDVNHIGPPIKNVADVLAPGDLIRLQVTAEKQYALAQIPQVSGALVSIRPNDGAIQALTGGFDFYFSKFNRAIQAQRQAGSGLKPFIYSAALENGFTAASLINDAPVVFEDTSLENTWRPENYSGKFFGPTRIREALTKSRNLVSIRLLRAIGPDTAIAHLNKFGFDRARLPRDLSLALGSASLTPFEMASAYTVFANGGYRVKPHFLTRIKNTEGEDLFILKPTKVCPECESTLVSENGDPVATDELDFIPATRSVPADNVYIMTSMMRDVVSFGTARRALALGRSDLSGKTGTTNDQLDAWFNGFNQQLVTTAWVGFDQGGTLGARETGGRAALPMWIEYMQTALKDVKEIPLHQPEGIVTIRIDRETGLQTTASSENAMFEIFRVGTEPEMEDKSGVNINSDTGSPNSQPSADPIF